MPQAFPVRDAEVLVFDGDPDTDDASDMYVLKVAGISVLVRLRATPANPKDSAQLYVHIENEGRRPTELAVEVDNGGDAIYQI
ncbi:hypothetical protein [Micromonospora sp. NPDC005220]|uniref:hypothetical protein n=1 Tax=Micromonospora sp. NPDC005220 TaxID=3155589 RepID=UPI0033BD6184